MIQVYTGNGKGKTTAALGLAIRSAGAGMKVYIAQFAKSGNCSELKALAKFRNIKVEQFGTASFIKGKPSEKDIALARCGLEKVKKVLKATQCDLLILDEINIALKFKLLKLCDTLALIKMVPFKTELILTGRYAHPQIIKIADLVSEVKEVKHYFSRGIKARRGIEF
ncbi:MAG: cob(I)yrinic acid a,c-diamide adenosyltransferase [Candidatus Omnitrophica bacterium]|nr:cob(I)yrinic acid a,c-diamide adenosyltransferase [Candidatus Omnitrophota bacterium]